MDKNKDELVGLGGWLILPILGLIYISISLSILFLRNYLPIFQKGYWVI